MQSDVLQFVPLVTALVTSLGVTPLVRRFALSVGMVDVPNSRKIHTHPIPLLGGLAIYTGVLPTVIVLLDSRFPSQALAVLGAATLLLVVGILDDKGMLHSQVKLMVAMPLAAVILMIAGIRTQVLESAFGPLFPTALGVLRGLDYGVTLVWVVGITAACSILDHMDGLCAGIAGIAAFFFWWIATANGQVLVALLALSLVGAAAGFLWWNFSPAKIFMGDGGAMFLGFMLATLGLKLRFPHLAPSTQWMIPVLVLGVPIFDTTLVTISRLRRGLVPFRSPGKDHTAHRLTYMGLSQREAVMVLYAAGGILGVLAILVQYLPPLAAYGLLGLLLVVAAALIVMFERVYLQESTRRGGGV